ncbi:AraC family transcriptional regulator [Roseateles cellulosilyticus]|uniref:Helix-turn-helix transcriptional regulator n=1 Tax=Pelomonas cellulosilytica TaxID=2906762 RepID=A0ABS8XQB5_9BURK|nr:helix-turn-helix transcriptional regulator [Pelomonas sp. P8]MCE4553480.1 helix-turn-helix transcriptional regulator [Pelomonas sp. P8]
MPPATHAPILSPGGFTPTDERPLRAKSRQLEHRADIQPHRHDWAQLVFSVSGAVRVNTEASTYIVPPQRAVWIPQGLVHAVTAIEHCDLRTVYLHGSLLTGATWQTGRVLEVSPLLRELLLALPTLPDPEPAPAAAEERRRRSIEQLVILELQRARPLALGVALPADARLRRLCEAMLREPGRHAGLEDWALEAGYSPRTLSRLFREQLSTSFAQWRSQLLLAHALTLAARGRPMSVIASELGYASASAFTAMVTRTVGMPPSRFFESA